MKPPVPVVALKWGDKITATVQKPRRDAFVAQGVVHSVLPNRGVFFAQLSENGKAAHNVYLNVDDEGDTWVRGHVDVGSPEELRNYLKATAAAEALDQ